MVLGRIATVAGAVAVLFGGMLGSAGLAVADEGDGPTYVMPTLEGGGLDKASEAIAELSPDLKLDVGQVLHFSQKPKVLSNWKVCWQNPEAGVTFTAKEWVGVGITRKGTECW